MKLKKSTIKDLFWGTLRWRKRPEIMIKTYYPGCSIKITKPASDWAIEISNGDEHKITTQEIYLAFENLLRQEFPGNCTLKRGLAVDFRLDSVSLENWRDITQGRIQELIDDTNNHIIHPDSNKIGAFGVLQGRTKPVRLKFIEYAQKFPNYFEYIETQKYSSQMKKCISLLEYKRKFKYIIDLTGHTYSTKSYWMLFLQRPLFYVEPNLKFRWEKKLKPWIHYIPVKRDLSDLVKHYEWAEKNPNEVKQLTENLYKFGIYEMSPEQVTSKLIKDIKYCIA